MKCYLCGFNDFFKREGEVRDAPKINILECVNCGLVELDSKQNITPQFYKNSGMHGKKLNTIEYWLNETDWDDQRRFDMLKENLINKKILDFGCGAGGFLNKAKKFASYAAGIEPENRVREYWGEKLNIFSSRDDSNFAKGNFFDLITAFHVIEHLQDPRFVLDQIRNNLKKDGNLVIEVPNSTDSLLSLYNCKPFKKFYYWSMHLFIFNSSNLASLLEQSGFRVLSIQYYQRYPLSNHLYWLSHGRANGHKIWAFLESEDLKKAYSATLIKEGKTDTLIAFAKKL